MYYLREENTRENALNYVDKYIIWKTALSFVYLKI